MKSSAELVDTALVGHDSQIQAISTRIARSNCFLARMDGMSNLAEYFYQYLDVDVLLEKFCQQARRAVSFASITFESKQLDISFADGVSATCNLTFEIDDGERYLGTLQISREDQFLSREIRTIDALVNTLRRPLRNASLYRKACQSAYIDPLTGLQNRAAFDQSLPREIAAAHRYQNPLTLMVLDVDRFKTINDEYGHAAGDEVLRQFASCLNRVVRDSDLVYRYGGDEFVIAMASTALTNARDIAERIRSSIAQVVLKVGDKKIRLTATIGMSELVPDESMDDAFLRADAALLKGKKEGKNCVYAK